MNEKLSSAPCMAFPDTDKDFYLEVRFSSHSVALGYDNDKCLLAYTSQPMSSVEMKFLDCEKGPP